MSLEKRILIWVVCSNIGATAGGFISIMTGFQFLVGVISGLSIGLFTAFSLDRRYNKRKPVPEKLSSGKIYTNGTGDKRKKPAS